MCQDRDTHTETLVFSQLVENLDHRSNGQVGPFSFLVKRLIQRFHQGLFDFAAGQVSEGLGELNGVEFVGIPVTPPDHSLPDGLAFSFVGQVHEEQLVPSPLAQQFLWRLNHVGGGNNRESQYSFEH